MKETLTLRNAETQHAFTYNLRTSPGLEVFKNSSGGIDFVSGDDVKFSFAPPFMFDSAADPEPSHAVSMDLQESPSGAMLTVAADGEWLSKPERVWPVVIDPNVVFGTGTLGCTIYGPTYWGSSVFKNWTNCGGSTLEVGVGGYSNTSSALKRTLLSFDLSSIPLFSDVFGADLALKGGCCPGIDLHRVTQEWQWQPTSFARQGSCFNVTWIYTGAGSQSGQCSTTWTTEGSTFDPTPSATSPGAGADGWAHWAPVDLVQDWVNGTVSNHGVVLKALNETNGNYASFCSSSCTDTPPYLEVFYETDPLPGDDGDAPQDSLRAPGTADPEDPSAALPTTPTGQVLVADANVQQFFVDSPQEEDCSNEQSYCNSAGREKAFARRIKKLGQKPLGDADIDGMGYVPDIILLQEVRCQDVEGIRDALNGRIRVNGNDADFRTAKCRSNVLYPEPDGNSNGVVQNDTAILFNFDTLRRLDDGTYVTTKYQPSDRPDSCKQNPVPFVDADFDGVNDCEVKWKRHFVMSFAERDSDFTFALASVHLIPFGHLSPAANESKREQWSNKLASRLSALYPDVDSYFLGGDFNITRCAEDPVELPSDSKENQVCTQRAWWNTLSSNGYEDAIYENHGDPMNANTQIDLDNQYRDGCNDSDQDEVCDNFRPAKRRIDYIFSLSAPGTAASHDLTCGFDDRAQDFPLHCRVPGHPRKYSDHRLVWTLATHEQ